MAPPSAVVSPGSAEHPVMHRAKTSDEHNRRDRIDPNGTGEMPGGWLRLVGSGGLVDKTMTIGNLRETNTSRSQRHEKPVRGRG